MYEISLVPDIKAELLKAQKMRNFVIYISIMVAVVCIGVFIILGAIAGGQGIALANQDNDMKQKSERILGSENINLNLTIQDQLGKLSSIGDRRRVLSRVFGVLDVILPTGDDQVSLSELSINLPNSTLSFDGQANSTSQIDYRALEVFKKTVELSYYDYGRYIDADGNEIPSFCIEETVENGQIIGLYNIGTEGCGEATIIEIPVDETENGENGEGDATGDATTPPADGETPPATTPAVPEPIRIIRDMTASQLDTAINSGQPYFQSECIDGGVNACPLAAEAVNIRESSNGRNSAGDLVLRFSAVVTLDSEAFSFNNKHLRVIGPTRQNVTDSYIQVRNMFTEEAEECAADDLECLNAGGGQ